MHDSMLKELLREAKKMLKEWFEGRVLWRDYPMYIVNTEEGARAYYRETGKPPVLIGFTGCSEYGSLESHGGKHFIFLNSIIEDNHCEGDILSTFIHEILHILHRKDSEERVHEMCESICEHFRIEPEDCLEE